MSAGKDACRHISRLFFDKDIRILLGVMRRESQSEMAAATLSAVSLINYRLKSMIASGLVEEPKERKARSLKLTPLGQEALQSAGVKIQ